MHSRWALALAATFGLVLAASAQAQGLKTTLDLTLPGIHPLDADSLESALNYGETHGALLNDPFVARSNEFKQMNRSAMTVDDAARFARLMDKQPFAFLIVSPYSNATAFASEAKRKFQPRPTYTAEQFNSGLVIVQVGPSASFPDADAVENVVLKRGDTAIRPSNAKVQPIEIRNGFAVARTVSEGQFTFPFEAFDPSASVTIVIVGRNGNFEWTLTPLELSRLK